jgi:hypothetical protein
MIGTHCIRNGVRKRGLWLDHSLPLQPMVSVTPHTTAVGNNHHMRKRVACTACTTTGKKYDRGELVHSIERDSVGELLTG